MHTRPALLGWLVIQVALALAACGGREPDDGSSSGPVADAGPGEDGAVDEADAGAGERDAGPRIDERPSCAESWGAAPTSEPHWIALDDLGELRMVDISDPNSASQVVSTSLEAGERVLALEPGWSPDGRWF